MLLDVVGGLYFYQTILLISMLKYVRFYQSFKDIYRLVKTLNNLEFHHLQNDRYQKNALNQTFEFLQFYLVLLLILLSLLMFLSLLLLLIFLHQVYHF